VDALPGLPDDINLLKSLLYLPAFEAAHRSLPTADRIGRLFELANVMIPLQRHVKLAHALDALIKNSYTGRAPRTRESAAIAQSLYEQRQAGAPFRQNRASVSAQISAALIGISGSGKTSGVVRFLATIDQVIHHPEMDNLYQIPYLVVEAPSDGSSVKGLAHAILHKLDQLIPGANYFNEFGLKARMGADVLMRQVAHLMHVHRVGLLVIDEVQNLANARKGSQVLMTELVSACNELRVALLFIGTYAAIETLSTDFRQARRAAGFGISMWDRLPERVSGSQLNEWRQFLEVLWRFQWVRHPAPLTDAMASLLYSCCQGVIGIAIRLVISAQARAMLDGIETINEEVIQSVYESEFRTLHPMLKALREGIDKDLAQYPDIAPPQLDHMKARFLQEAETHTQPINTTTSDHRDFVPRLKSALVAAGTAPELAGKLAQTAARGDKPVTVAQAAIECIQQIKPVRRRRGVNKDKPSPETFAPDDYRRAVAAAEASGNLEREMRERGMSLSGKDILEKDFATI